MTTPAYPRTHDRLRREATRDPVFLFQQRRTWWSWQDHYEWDGDDEVYRYTTDDDLVHDAAEAGQVVELKTALEAGWAIQWWETVTVFATREEAEAHGQARAYRYPDGWRVYCVHAEGDLVHALAAATEGGRYQ